MYAETLNLKNNEELISKLNVSFFQIIERIWSYLQVFYATFIQMRGLASYKSRFDPPFSRKLHIPIHEYDSCYPFVWCTCLSFWFCHLITDFSFWIFLWVRYFCYFTFYCHISTIITKWNTRLQILSNDMSINTFWNSKRFTKI